MLRLLTLVILLPAPAFAWNALGHKVIADIAWEQLPPARQQAIVDTLRRHPRFDEDFAKQMPADADEGRWIFQQAAIWPDIARGFKGADLDEYHRPTWHYVNFPYYIDATPAPFGLNLYSGYESPIPADKWNVCQATKHCLDTLASDDPPSDRALAYCWLLHLVGDLHQPMHSTALIAERFPTGDRGGNLIPVVQGENLHSLWDGLLGRRDEPNDVKREVAELKAVQELWRVDTKPDVDGWIKESYELAKSFAYSPVIVEAVKQPGPGPLQPINLPEDYLKAAGQHAQARIVAAGLRIGALLQTDSKGDDFSRQLRLCCLIVLAVTLAVARGVPILNVFLPRDIDAGFWAAVTIVPFGVIIAFAGYVEMASLLGAPLQAIGLGILLVYHWWCAAWYLRAGE